MRCVGSLAEEVILHEASVGHPAAAGHAFRQWHSIFVLLVEPSAVLECVLVLPSLASFLADSSHIQAPTSS